LSLAILADRTLLLLPEGGCDPLLVDIAQRAKSKFSHPIAEVELGNGPHCWAECSLCTRSFRTSELRQRLADIRAEAETRPMAIPASVETPKRNGFSTSLRESLPPEALIDRVANEQPSSLIRCEGG